LQNIQLSYPDIFLFYIAVIAVLYALSLYISTTKLKKTKTWLPGFLGTLRFLSVLAILFMLLYPLLRLITTENEKPAIVFIQDESHSIRQVMDSTSFAAIDGSLDALKNRLQSDYKVTSHYFGQDIKTESLDSLARSSTNISNALEFVSDNYEDQNIGAVILSSDGIYNEGKNPLYTDLDMSVPVYSIALGDTTQRRDIIIKNVLHNRIVYLNDKFIIEADIQAYNARGTKSELLLSQVQNGQKRIIDRTNVNIDSDNYFESYQFELEANTAGAVRYVLEARGIANESSYDNNYRNMYIDVLDARQRVLLLAAYAHPDIKTLRQILESSKNYEVDLAYAEEPIEGLGDHDVVLLHNLPSPDHGLENEITLWNNKKTPLFFILGSGTDRTAFNSVQSVIELAGQNLSLNNVTPVVNSEFSVFKISEDLERGIGNFVPLKSPFGEYTLQASAQALLSQKIGSVPTDYPLLAFSNIDNRKTAVLAGEGIWRWQLTEYFETESSQLTSEIIQKTIQYITVKDDKRQFRAYTNKKEFKENESVLFDAQLYNDNYELINGPEASLVIRNEDNERFEYIFSKNQDYYILDAGRFKEGSYSYSATTEYNGRRFTSSGRFTIQSLVKEAYDLTARHDILNQISNKYGGQMIMPADIDSIYSFIKNDSNIKTVMYQKATTRPLLDWPWFLIIILSLLCIEWFFRRYFGAY